MDVCNVFDFQGFIYKCILFYNKTLGLNCFFLGGVFLNLIFDASNVFMVCYVPKIINTWRLTVIPHTERTKTQFTTTTRTRITWRTYTGRITYLKNNPHEERTREQHTIRTTHTRRSTMWPRTEWTYTQPTTTKWRPHTWRTTHMNNTPHEEQPTWRTNTWTTHHVKNKDMKTNCVTTNGMKQNIIFKRTHNTWRSTYLQNNSHDRKTHEHITIHTRNTWRRTVRPRTEWTKTQFTITTWRRTIWRPTHHEERTRAQQHTWRRTLWPLTDYNNMSTTLFHENTSYEEYHHKGPTHKTHYTQTKHPSHNTPHHHLP